MALRHPIQPPDEVDDFIMPPEEARAYFESEIQRLLGMSGDEFLRRYDAGEYLDMEDSIENRNYLEASFLISFGRAGETAEEAAARRNSVEHEEIDMPEGVTFLTGQAALDYFEQEVQRLVGMSGAEFIRRYDSGEYETMEDIPENWNIFEAAFLIPFGRNNS